MKAVDVITGTGLPLKRSDVDTDQIIPAVYLKRVTRTGFEDGLFSAWRDDPAFVVYPLSILGGEDVVNDVRGLSLRDVRLAGELVRHLGFVHDASLWVDGFAALLLRR
jgi:hypothetical protein